MPSKTLAEADLAYEGAGIILVDTDGHILILRDSRCNKWSFPKGAPEETDGGDPLRTALRECAEEAGLTEGIDFELASPTPFFSHFTRHYFLGRLKEGYESRLRLSSEEINASRFLNPRKSCPYWTDLNSGVREFIRRSQRGVCCV